MPVNPITGIVTYTLDEWKEESQLWEHNGALLERERITKLLEPLFDTAENAETRRLLTMAITLIRERNK